MAARAEPVAACQAFAAEALAAGAIIETDCAVTDLRPVTGGGWEVAALEQVFGADAVIIAAGPWCAQLGAMVGVDVPIVGVRGQMWASEPQPLLLRHAIAGAESFESWSREVGDELSPPEPDPPRRSAVDATPVRTPTPQWRDRLRRRPRADQ